MLVHKLCIFIRVIIVTMRNNLTSDKGSSNCFILSGLTIVNENENHSFELF
jgi:hypothetical protein